jgi:serine/threonine-protein kinase RsbW
MQISFTLCLPRDEASVPIVRHICRDALDKLGVERACVSDIELAVTEACTNVLEHAQASDEDYEVQVEVDEATCRIKIVDNGPGFDGDPAGRETSGLTAESGRGIFLMRAMVDDLRFVSEPQTGTMVHLAKTLTLKPGSFLELLAARRTGIPEPVSAVSE